MQKVYIFLKRASTHFRFFEKVRKSIYEKVRIEWDLGLGEAIIFF